MNPFQYQNVFSVTFLINLMHPCWIKVYSFLFTFVDFHFKKSYITAPNIVCVQYIYIYIYAQL